MNARSWAFRSTSSRGKRRCGAPGFRRTHCISYDRTVTWGSPMRMRTLMDCVGIVLSGYRCCPASASRLPRAKLSAPMISIVLIEDNRLVREGIAAMLNQQRDFRVVGALSSGDPELLRSSPPQVILLDLGLW